MLLGSGSSERYAAAAVVPRWHQERPARRSFQKEVPLTVIAASGILVVVAFVTLIVGVFNAGLSLIWTSIAASVLAAIFLALGVVQGNKRRMATAGSSTAPTPSWDQPATVAQRETFADVEPEPPSLSVVPEPEPEPETAVIGFEERAPAQPRTRSAAPSKPAARKPAARKPAAPKPAAVTAGQVVIIPDRDKYHKDSCRYAKNAAAMTMTKASARREGYKPCGVCKP